MQTRRAGWRITSRIGTSSVKQALLPSSWHLAAFDQPEGRETGTEAQPGGKLRQATPPAYEATDRAGRSAPSTSFFEARSWRLPSNARHDRWLVFRTASKSGGGLTRVAVADTDLRAPRRSTFCCVAPRGCVKSARAGGRRLFAPCAESARARGRGDCLVTQAHSSRNKHTSLRINSSVFHESGLPHTSQCLSKMKVGIKRTCGGIIH